MSAGFSVVMVSYYTGPVLFASVKAALRQEHLAELIVVSNGNVPDMLARLQQISLTDPRLKIISGQGNIGLARGCNIGSMYATGEYILFLHPDCLLSPGTFEGILAGFREVPQSMVASAWLQNADGSERVGGRREMLTPLTALSHILGLHRVSSLKPFSLHRAPMPEHAYEVPAISSAFMVMRRNAFQILGGFDESFFLFGEDIDLCLRARKTGGKVIFVPQVKVTRMVSSKGKPTSRRLEWQKTKDALNYFDKHFKGEYMPGVLLLVHTGLLLRYTWKGLTFGVSGERKPPLLSQGVPAKRLMVLASGLAELPEDRSLYGKTVLVTGATSQVGLCVVRRLIASGAAVLAMSRGPAIPFQHEHLRWIQADLTDEGLHLQGYLVDIVVHCAPLWHLPSTVGMLAESDAKRIIAFGTTSIFAKALSGNSYEKKMVEKLAKAETELAARCAEKHIEWTILRPTLTYGVGLDLNVTSIAKFIFTHAFFPVYPPAFGRRQPVHADDLAAGVLQVIAAPVTCGKSYNLSGGEILTYRGMLERLFAICQKKISIKETTLLPFILDVAGWLSRKPHINGEIARRMNDDLVFFHDDATRDFGFHPRTFLSGGIKDIEGF